LYELHLIGALTHSWLCRGALIGHPVENLRVVLTDGASHAVDSSELAFKLAALYAFRQVQFLHRLSYNFNDHLRTVYY